MVEPVRGGLVGSGALGSGVVVDVVFLSTVVVVASLLMEVHSLVALLVLADSVSLERVDGVNGGKYEASER